MIKTMCTPSQNDRSPLKNGERIKWSLIPNWRTLSFLGHQLRARDINPNLTPLPIWRVADNCIRTRKRRHDLSTVP